MTDRTTTRTRHLTCQRPPAEIVASYREQCARSNAVLEVTALTAAPLGRHNGPDENDQPPTVRWVVLHMIEETACHSGHLDIAREIADGKTNLGAR